MIALRSPQLQCVMRSSVVQEPWRLPARTPSCCSSVWFKANSTYRQRHGKIRRALLLSASTNSVSSAVHPRGICHKGVEIVQAQPVFLFKNILTLIYNEATILSVCCRILILLQGFHFFQEIFIHFSYKLTTGKSRPQNAWQGATDFFLKERKNREERQS